MSWSSGAERVRPRQAGENGDRNQCKAFRPDLHDGRTYGRAGSKSKRELRPLHGSRLRLDWNSHSHDLGSRSRSTLGIPMPIEIACPQCQCVLKAPEGMGGKKARCKRCQHSFRIPGGKADSEADSTGDPENLSVISESPFSFDAPASPPAPAKPAGKKPSEKATPKENPFAAVTAPGIVEPEDPTPLPKSLPKSKSKAKPDEPKPNPRASSYRSKATAPAAKSRTPLLLFAALLCAGGRRRVLRIHRIPEIECSATGAAGSPASRVDGQSRFG